MWLMIAVSSFVPPFMRRGALIVRPDNIQTSEESSMYHTKSNLAHRNISPDGALRSGNAAVLVVALPKVAESGNLATRVP